MPSNVEIKAAVRNLQHLMRRAGELSESGGTIIRQQDTFFTAQQGRLKLRNFMVRLNNFLHGMPFILLVIPQKSAVLKLYCFVIGWERTAHILRETGYGWSKAFQLLHLSHY